MINEKNSDQEYLDAVILKAEARIIWSEALGILISNNQLLNQIGAKVIPANGHTAEEVEQAAAVLEQIQKPAEISAPARGPRKAILLLRRALSERLREVLYSERGKRINRPVLEKLAALLVHLRESGEANRPELAGELEVQLIAISSYTKMLKEAGLITYEGSKKNGKYRLTPKAESLIQKIRG